jgi:tRNA-splicing ligase RtcB (3'-phosphate/5'-hydroxy nucleic acid ligase)
MHMRDLRWCQDYALQNRVEMMNRVLKDLSHEVNHKDPVESLLTVNCHHNYVAEEFHYGEQVLITRKGAVRAWLNDYGIIPGSMGAKSFIVKGKGNIESFQSCSHGAGRKLSRTQARALFSVEDLKAQTAHVECRKDAAIIDEIPAAYKDIDRVMENQNDLVSIEAELRQILCVKG